MQTKLVSHDGKAVIVLEGRFDFNSHLEFGEVVEQAMKSADQGVQVDLAAIDYLDSSALGMLLMLRDEAKAAGKEVELAKAQGSVRQVIDIANFGKLFALV